MSRTMRNSLLSTRQQGKKSREGDCKNNGINELVDILVEIALEELNAAGQTERTLRDEPK